MDEKVLGFELYNLNSTARAHMVEEAAISVNSRMLKASCYKMQNMASRTH